MAALTKSSPTQDKYDAVLAALVLGDREGVDKVTALFSIGEWVGLKGAFESAPTETKQAMKASIAANPNVLHAEALPTVLGYLKDVKMPSPVQVPAVKAAGLASLPTQAMPPMPTIRPTYTPANSVSPVNLVAAAEALRSGAVSLATRFLSPAAPVYAVTGIGSDYARSPTTAKATSYAAAPEIDRVTGAKSAVGNIFKSYENILQEQAGTIRSQALSPALVSVLESAAKEAGVQVRVFSGGQTSNAPGQGTGSTRHNGGNAADLNLYVDGRKLDMNNPRDLPIVQAFIAASIQGGANGIGAGKDYSYMGTGIHIGFGPTGQKGGPVTVWGAKGATINAPAWLAALAQNPRAMYVSLGLPLPPALPMTQAAQRPSFKQTSVNGIASRVLDGQSLRKGTTGRDVADLQRFLNERGYKDRNGNALKVDGKLGTRTSEAVRRYQAERGLKVDGIVGRRTVAEMVKDQVVPPNPRLRPGDERAVVRGEPNARQTQGGGRVPNAGPIDTTNHTIVEQAGGGSLHSFPNVPGVPDVRSEINVPRLSTVSGTALSVGLPIHAANVDRGSAINYEQPNAGLHMAPGTYSVPNVGSFDPRAGFTGGEDKGYNPDMLDLQTALNSEPHFAESAYYSEQNAPPSLTLGGDSSVLSEVNNAFARASREATAARQQEARFATEHVATFGGAEMNQQIAAILGYGSYGSESSTQGAHVASNGGSEQNPTDSSHSSDTSTQSEPNAQGDHTSTSGTGSETNTGGSHTGTSGGSEENSQGPHY